MLVNIIWSRDKWLGPLACDHLVHMVPDRQWLSWLLCICSVSQTSASPEGSVAWRLQWCSPPPWAREMIKVRSKGRIALLHVLHTSPWTCAGFWLLCQSTLATSKCSGSYNQDCKMFSVYLILCTPIISASTTEQKIPSLLHLGKHKLQEVKSFA